jgi:hypothetical protein
MAVIAVCCIASGTVNIFQLKREQIAFSATIEQTLQEFLNPKSGPTKKDNHAPVLIQDTVDDKADLKDREDMPHFAQDDTATPSDFDLKTSGFTAHLSCTAHGGPNDEYAQEMVYWSDIPSDARYVSPFRAKRGQQRRYLTFEPDGGKKKSLYAVPKTRAAFVFSPLQSSDNKSFNKMSLFQADGTCRLQNRNCDRMVRE